MQSLSRPAGPRDLQRTRSPSPAPFALPETQPLNIRKTSSASLSPPAQSLSRSPTPLLSLQIPGSGNPRQGAPSLQIPIPGTLRPNAPTLQIPSVGNPRPSTPKLSLLQIPSSNGISSNGQTGSDSPTSNAPFQGAYYGGPTNAPLELDDQTPDDRDVTITPFSVATSRKPAAPLDDIRRTLDQANSSSSVPNTTGEEGTETPVWSDDVLEEVGRLGEGAGGAVHKVRDVRNDLIMARKTITTREAPLKQLLRELNIISSTKHDNITVFHGTYMSPSSSEVKILMEYCEGGSLEAVGKQIKDRGARVGEKVAGRLAEGILQGLNYLHSKKTIHRDIKPSNILLSRDGVVKLCDFGVSGELVDSLAGTFTGTSFYMAPERISGQEYTIRSDVWSTGISLLELVQNRFPFPNDLGPIDLIVYITRGPSPKLDDEPDVQWSDSMKDFIDQTLIVDSLARPTPRDMLAHPWVIAVMQQEVNMGRWIRQVWGWPKTSRRSRDEYVATSAYSPASNTDRSSSRPRNSSTSRPPSSRRTTDSSDTPQSDA